MTDVAKKKVLHVGCGQARKENMHAVFHGPEWQEIRLDIDESARPDIKGDIRDMPDVQTESMDAVYSSHNVEHVYAYEVPIVLGEFHRTLKPGGYAVITLPDIQSVAFAVANGKLEDALYQSPAGPITPLEIMYGLNNALKVGQHYMAHKTAFTANSLARKMLDAGFHNVTVTRDVASYNLWAQGYKLGGQLKNPKHEANIKGQYQQAVVTLPKDGERLDELDAEPTLGWPQPEQAELF